MLKNLRNNYHIIAPPQWNFWICHWICSLKIHKKLLAKLQNVTNKKNCKCLQKVLPWRRDRWSFQLPWLLYWKPQEVGPVYICDMPMSNTIWNCPDSLAHHWRWLLCAVHSDEWCIVKKCTALVMRTLVIWSIYIEESVKVGDWWFIIACDDELFPWEVKWICNGN